MVVIGSIEPGAETEVETEAREIPSRSAPGPVAAIVGRCVVQEPPELQTLPEIRDNEPEES